MMRPFPLLRRALEIGSVYPRTILISQRFLRKNRMETAYFAGMKSKLLDDLDVLDSNNSRSRQNVEVTSKQKKKLSQKLEDEPKPVVDGVNQSIMDANGNFMCNILNEALETPGFRGIINDLHTTLGLEIREVKET